MVTPYTGHWVHRSYSLHLSFLGFTEHLNLQFVFLQIWGIFSPYFLKYFFLAFPPLLSNRCGHPDLRPLALQAGKIASFLPAL